MSSTIAERYIRAAQGINLHHKGFIDAYFGNPAWTTPNSSTLHDLEFELEQLQAEIGRLEAVERRDFLRLQTTAMQTLVKLKRGESLSFLEEVRGLHDIEPIRQPESLFEVAHQTLEELLPGTGSLNERRQAARENFKLSPNRLQAVIDVISLELQSRTRQLFKLPESESCEYALVQNKPWGGYNWYLGAGRSRVEVNLDLPKYLTDMPDLIAHESYPGHHTEHVIKERKLLLENDWQEFSIQLLDSPESVLAEGIATSALEVVMSDSELAEWLAGELAQVAGLKLSLEEVEKTFQIAKAYTALGYVEGNAALMLFENQVDEPTILGYLKHYRLSNTAEAEKKLAFIKHARGYVYTYTTGYDQLKSLFERGDKVTMFQRLLEHPVTPSQLRAWVLEARDTRL
jgi:Mor family transcriptional regulator